MKHLKLAVIASSLVAAAAFSGCAGHDTAYKGNAVKVEASHNLLGIAKTYPGSYRYVESTGSVILRTEDLWGRRDFSGDSTAFLWGLINVCDY